MPTREQVRAMLDAGQDYQAVARRLGIPAGQAYLIATGRPADGGDTPSHAESDAGRPQLASQHLAPHENPTGSESVHRWAASRAMADAQMQAASAARTAEPAEPHPDGASRDVVMVLTRDHNQVWALMRQLEARPGHRTGGSPDDLAARKSIVDMMTVRLSQHESVEEEYFWPTVRSVLPDGDDWADQALAQEQAGKETLTELSKLDPDADEFDDLVERLVKQLRQHVAHEEKIFLALSQVMDEQEREKLGTRIASGEKQAPARPPRHAPQKPARP